jgi:hypothetical protein
MTYGDTPKKYKIKVFDVERNDAGIEEIKTRVKLCREYIQELVNKLP